MKTDLNAVREQFGPLVWSIAIRILNQHADAVECYQDVFLELIENSGEEKIQNWGAYLRWLTTRRAIDSLRRNRTHALQRESIELNLIAEGGDPFEMLQFDELIDVVRNELQLLPEKQAQAFWLVSVEQCTHQETARLMNVQPNHVSVLVHRARQALRQRLEHLMPPVRSTISRDSK